MNALINNIYHASVISEKVLVAAVQYAGYATLAASVIPIAIFAKGYIVSFLTGGQFTTVHSAILRGPIIGPLIIPAFKTSLIITIACGVLLGLSVAGKCISASLSGRPITWENWRLV